MRLYRSLFCLVCSLFLVSCGGGSSDSGMLIEGTLTEAGGSEQTRGLALRHEAGERIEGVQVCTLGVCSLTDDAGQWGFEVTKEFTGGELLFTFVGHGLNNSTVVSIPLATKQAFIEFEHHGAGHGEPEGSGTVEAHQFVFDGAATDSTESEDHAHTHES
jgi:hypothetical protein